MVVARIRQFINSLFFWRRARGGAFRLASLNAAVGDGSASPTTSRRAYGRESMAGGIHDYTWVESWGVQPKGGRLTAGYGGGPGGPRQHSPCWVGICAGLGLAGPGLDRP